MTTITNYVKVVEYYMGCPKAREDTENLINKTISDEEKKGARFKEIFGYKYGFVLVFELTTYGGQNP